MKILTAILLVLISAIRVSAQDSAWHWEGVQFVPGFGVIIESASAHGSTPSGSSSSLIIRYRAPSSKCDVFFIPDSQTLVDAPTWVLVKFNDKPAKRYSVLRSERALFFSDPVAILRAIRDNGGYMTVEYASWVEAYGLPNTVKHEIWNTVKYEIWNLPPSILKRIQK